MVSTGPSFRERDRPAVQFAVRAVADDVLAATQQQAAQRFAGPLVNRGVRSVGEIAAQVAGNAGQPVMHRIREQLQLAQNVPGPQVLRRGRQRNGPAARAVVGEIVRRVNQSRPAPRSVLRRARSAA